MSASSMLWIPGYAIYYLWTGEGTLAEVTSFPGGFLAAVKPKHNTFLQKLQVYE